MAELSAISPRTDRLLVPLPRYTQPTLSLPRITVLLLTGMAPETKRLNMAVNGGR